MFSKSEVFSDRGKGRDPEQENNTIIFSERVDEDSRNPSLLPMELSYLGLSFPVFVSFGSVSVSGVLPFLTLTFC